MTFNRFKDIIIWKKSKELTILIYELLEKHNDFGYKNQIQRAAVSIMNNITKGYERQTQKVFRQFLYVSKSSYGKNRSMLYLTKKLNIISAKDFKKLLNSRKKSQKYYQS